MIENRVRVKKVEEGQKRKRVYQKMRDRKGSTKNAECQKHVPNLQGYKKEMQEQERKN